MSNVNEMMFHDLQIFSAAVALKSYTGAAQKLGIDVSNVGRRIKVLEAELNCQLVIRNKRELVITSDGMRLYNAFLKHEQSFGAMLDRFESIPENEIGEIDLAIPNGIIENILCPRIPAYLKHHPNIGINLMSQNREMNLIAEKYDFAIVRQIPAQNSLKIKKLYEIKIHLFCTPQYAERYGIPKTLDELNKHMVLGRLRDDLTKMTQYQVCNEKTQITGYMMPRFNTNNIAIDKQIVMGHDVIVGGVDYLYKEELANGKIIKVLPEYYFQTGFQSFYLVSDGSKHRRKIVQDFMDFIIRVFDEINSESD